MNKVLYNKAKKYADTNIKGKKLELKCLAEMLYEFADSQITDLKANFYYVLEGKDLEIKILGERCNQLLKDKGNLTDELAKWKEEWQEQVQKATDESWERTKLTGRVRELEQENNKLLDVINNQDVKIADLEQQIEKMKTELDNARESANRQEQWEIYSVLNDLYNDNFEITKGVSN